MQRSDFKGIFLPKNVLLPATRLNFIDHCVNFMKNNLNFIGVGVLMMALRSILMADWDFTEALVFNTWSLIQLALLQQLRIEKIAGPNS